MPYNILDYQLINMYPFIIWNLLRLTEPSGNLSPDRNLALQLRRDVESQILHVHLGKLQSKGLNPAEPIRVLLVVIEVG